MLNQQLEQQMSQRRRSPSSPVLLLLRWTTTHPLPHLSQGVRVLRKGVWVGGLASALGVVLAIAGGVPDASQMGAGVGGWRSVAIAQSPNQIRKYVLTLFEIEHLRLNLRRQVEGIQRESGGSSAAGDGEVCQGQVSPAVRKVCKQFLKEASVIIRRNGLTNEEFNALRSQQQTDGKVKGQIFQELEAVCRNRKDIPSSVRDTQTVRDMCAQVSS